MKRTRFEASLDKRQAVNAAEASGELADSQSVRLALIQRMHAGEITLEQVQSELAKIKRNAKKNGLKTRNQVFRES